MRIFTGTRNGWILRPTLRLLLLLLSVLPATHGGAVKAASTGIAGEWEISFEVRNSTVRAIWIGRVYDYDESGKGELLSTRRVDISDDCLSFGEPIFGVSDVTFDGVDDYIRCTIPNFQMIFAEMNPALVACYCRFDSPPYAAADVSPVYSTATQPVVYHDRLHLDVLHVDTESVRIPIIRTSMDKEDARKESSKTSEIAPNAWRDPARVDSNNSLGLVQLTLHFSGTQTLSWESNLSNVWHKDGFQVWAGYDAAGFAAKNSMAGGAKDGWAKFLADKGFWDEVLPSYVNGFFMWETDANAKYDADPMPPGFVLGPLTPLYIGYNPKTETFFDGTIRTIAIDPGCRGH